LSYFLGYYKQQEKNSPELEILKTKEILKNLYEKKENFEW